jgi:hypothetical protein
MVYTGEPGRVTIPSFDQKKVAGSHVMEKVGRFVALSGFRAVQEAAR